MKYVKEMMDKISFTFGVVTICSTQWVCLRQAEWFPLYHLTILTPLLVWRLISYTRLGYQLFMLGQSTLTHPLR